MPETFANCQAISRIPIIGRAKTARLTRFWCRMDTLTKSQRSHRMSLIRSKNTLPELAVRRIVHSMGFRFRLHRRDLPGSPDLVFPKWRCVIHVHGCFWHQHSCPVGSRIPKTRVRFWSAKLVGNVARDKRNTAKLRRGGWRVLRIWECQLTDVEGVKKRIRRFLLTRVTCAGESYRTTTSVNSALANQPPSSNSLNPSAGPPQRPHCKPRHPRRHTRRSG